MLRGNFDTAHFKPSRHRQYSVECVEYTESRHSFLTMQGENNENAPVVVAMK